MCIFAEVKSQWEFVEISFDGLKDILKRFDSSEKVYPQYNRSSNQPFLILKPF